MKYVIIMLCLLSGCATIDVGLLYEKERTATMRRKWTNYLNDNPGILQQLQQPALVKPTDDTPNKYDNRNNV